MAHNSYIMCICGLSDMYTRCTYQANHSSPIANNEKNMELEVFFSSQ